MLDLTSRTFGRLTVLSRVGSNKHGAMRWACRCACGNTVTTLGNTLRRGRVQSCGCLQNDRRQETLFKHGLTKTPEYRTWQNIKTRCRRPSHHAYKDYGGRGITMCERWANSFEHFLADVGQKPAPKHTIERINNNGNYEPGNVRWATQLEQNSNRRDSIRLEFRGRTITTREASELTGLRQAVITRRLRDGWTAERALNQALQVKRVASCRVTARELSA